MSLLSMETSTASHTMTTKNKSQWDRIPENRRNQLVWGLWFITWIGLVIGLIHREYFEYVVFFSTFHALLFLFLHGEQMSPFPVQVRIAYLMWVIVGTYVPHMIVVMYITTVGLATNLFFDYCPLARMMYLLPWNREETFSLGLVWRVFLSPPVTGRFKPTATTT